MLRKKKGDESGLMAQTVGLVYESLGDTKNAERWFIKGIEDNPKSMDVYVNPISFHLRNGNKKKAALYAKKLEPLFKKEPSSYRNSKFGKKIKDLIKKALE